MAKKKPVTSWRGVVTTILHDAATRIADGDRGTSMVMIIALEKMILSGRKPTIDLYREFYQRDADAFNAALAANTPTEPAEESATVEAGEVSE